jgi:hypothetical protein
MYSRALELDIEKLGFSFEQLEYHSSASQLDI